MAAGTALVHFVAVDESSQSRVQYQLAKKILLSSGQHHRDRREHFLGLSMDAWWSRDWAGFCRDGWCLHSGGNTRERTSVSI
jgi:hypothetical protein